MRLEFTYTAADLEEMAKAAAQPDPSLQKGPFGSGGSRSWIGWMIFVSLAVVLFLWMQKRGVAARPPVTPATPSSTNGVAGWLVALVPWVLIFGFIWFFVYRQIRHMSPRSVYERNPSMQQPKTLDITDDGVRMSDPLAFTEWRWASFTGLVESANLLLLRRADNTFVMIPKRAVAPGLLDTLRADLTARMPAPGAFPVLPPKRP
jgi:hypothetical protein